MKKLLFIILILISSLNFSQDKQDEKDSILHFGIQGLYNYHDLLWFNGPGGFKTGVFFQHSRYEYAVYGGYNWFTFYDRNTANSIQVMKDQFWRLGLQFNYLLYRIGPSGFRLGANIEKFFFKEHYYYYHSKTSGETYEITCTECPGKLTTNPMEYNFGHKYLWQFGSNIIYEVKFLKNLSLRLDVELGAVIRDVYLSKPPQFTKTLSFSLSPNIGLKYSFF